jgi:streptogramin lyase
MRIPNFRSKIRNTYTRVRYVPAIASLVVPFMGAFLPSVTHAAASPAITEYSLGHKNPQYLTNGPDGALWYTACTNNQSFCDGVYTIDRITDSGAVTSFSGMTHTPQSITNGPDGALWFTESGSLIGRITTSGQITEYPIPVPSNAALASITTGSDGNLWFTDLTDNPLAPAIGRITPQGVVTMFPLPASYNTRPYQIIAGSDGALWFTEPYGNSIGRMTTDGNVTQYTIPSAQAGSDNSGSYYLTSGPDGAIWFGETVTNKIGRLTTGGTFTEYPTTTAPFTLATGADGNVWFSEPNNDTEIGDIAPATGVVTQTALPTPLSGSEQLAAGPNGNIWIGLTNISKLARVDLQPAAATLVQSINAGGAASGSYAADTGFTGGSSYSTAAVVDRSGVVSPVPEAVYQSVRYGNMTYMLPGLTPNTAYTLRLDFNEPYWGTGNNGGGIGSRVFNVSVNGQPALTNYDVYQQAGGANKAIAQQLPVLSDANGNVTIQFTNVTDNAIVSGIALYTGSLPPQPTPPNPAPSLLVNAGGGATGNFAADIDFSGGTSFGTTASADTSNVSSPAPQAVYQSVRYGTDFSYTISALTPGTSYKVRLHFNELYWGTALASNQGGVGSRIFNVTINNLPVLANYDIYAGAGGANKAVTQDFTASANANGKIVVHFTAVTDTAMVSGIEVDPITQ